MLLSMTRFSRLSAKQNTIGLAVFWTKKGRKLFQIQEQAIYFNKFKKYSF